jgi:hypothetical protein
MKKLYIEFISSFLITKVTVRLCPSLLHPWLPRVKKTGAQPYPWLANMRNWQPSLFNLHSERNIEQVEKVNQG